MGCEDTIHFRCKECNGTGCEPARTLVLDAIHSTEGQIALVNPGYGIDTCNDSEILEVHSWGSKNQYSLTLVPKKT